MTCEEAFESLAQMREQIEDEFYCKEELELALEAMKKQIPKKPLLTKDAVDTFGADDPLWGEGYCPNCEHYIRLPHKYCYKCGQAIDWEEK